MFLKKLTISALAITMLAINCGAQVASTYNLIETDVISLCPRDVLRSPAYLTDIWLNDPIPLAHYNDECIHQQKRINEFATDKIITYSPEKSAHDWLDIDHEEITPYTWKWMHLTLDNEDGTASEMQLRRPNWWIKHHSLDSIGNSLFIHLDELGAHGWVTVKAIRPNQLDTRLWSENRVGDFVERPIIGKFVHESSNVYDLYFDNENSIGITGNHPVWSHDRSDWVRADSIALGERVTTHLGKAKLTRSEKREGIHKVYNIEVYRSHNYFASRHRILVHNAPCNWRTLKEKPLRQVVNVKGNQVYYSTDVDELGTRLYYISKAVKVVDGKPVRANMAEILDHVKADAQKKGHKAALVRFNIDTDSGFDFEDEYIRFREYAKFFRYRGTIRESNSAIDFSINLE